MTVQGDIRDIKGPLEAAWPPDGLLAALVLLAAAAVAAVFLYWLRRRRKARAAPPPPPVPPGEAALAELNRLRAERLPEAGMAKEYFFRLTAILRRYFERRFGFPASEQTSEEFLAALAAGQILTPEQNETLRGFMKQADLVRYAKKPAVADDCYRADSLARKLILETP